MHSVYPIISHIILFQSPSAGLYEQEYQIFQQFTLRQSGIMNAALPISVTLSGVTTLTAPLSVHFFSTPSSISKISALFFPIKTHFSYEIIISKFCEA